MPGLSLNDHEAILNYYGIEYSKLNKKQIKDKAENILAEKLCRCIKSVDKNDEKKSIAICRKNVLINKGIDMYGFTCKNKPKFKQNKYGNLLSKKTHSIKKRITRKNKKIRR